MRNEGIKAASFPHYPSLNKAIHFAQQPACNPISHLLVMPTQEASVNGTKGKDQNQYHCSQRLFNALSTESLVPRDDKTTLIHCE
jgi:hypothetical protein